MPTSQAENFSQLLTALVTQYGGTKRQFAKAAGISPSQLSHLLRPGRYTPPPGIETCLKIARAAHCSASRVLRAGGKDAIADLIEELYGEAAQRRADFRSTRVAPHEEAHLSEWRLLAPADRRALSFIIARAVVARIKDGESGQMNDRTSWSAQTTGSSS